MTYLLQLPSAQPAWAGALRRADRPTWRFREDMEVRISAYESWECPLCVAKILDMDHILSYLWIRIFMDMNIMIRQIEEDAFTFHMHQSTSSYSTGNARKPPRHACLGAQSTSKKTWSGTYTCTAPDLQPRAKIVGSGLS